MAAPRGGGRITERYPNLRFVGSQVRRCGGWSGGSEDGSEDGSERFGGLVRRFEVLNAMAVLERPDTCEAIALRP